MAGRTKSAETTALDIYLKRLQDHLAIETKAIETVLSELPFCERYGSVSAQMEQDLILRRKHVSDITALLSRHGRQTPAAHETVSSILSTVSSLLSTGEESNLLKNVLTDVSYRAHQIASLNMLAILADRLGFSSDLSLLERLRNEETASTDKLQQHLPVIVAQYLANH